MVELLPIFKKAYWSLAGLGALYFLCLALLIHPVIQKHAVYMHWLNPPSWLGDVTKPEQFGFAQNQVTPFYLDTPDGEKIFAWHVVPLGLYTKRRDELVKEPAGVVEAPLETENLKLLASDPEARLIIHFHGNSGHVGTSHRPTYLRSLSAADPARIHILTIDYRGFGRSTGDPTEAGIILDGLTAVRFATEKLGIDSSRIALVGQSLGTAVTFGVAEALAREGTEVGAVISIAGFSALRTLVTTYRIRGFIPVLRPLFVYPKLQAKFTEYLYESWDSASRVRSLVHSSQKLNLVLVHAINDEDIPWQHVDELFLAAANATADGGLTASAIEGTKVVSRYGGESVRYLWPKEKSRGNNIEQWIVNWGGHDKVVTSAGTSVIVAKALGL